jgi:hypothetical protein
MKKTLALALALTVLVASLASPAAAKPRRAVVHNFVMQTTHGFSVGNAFAAGTMFGGTGEVRQRGARIGGFSSLCIATSIARAQCSVTFVWKGRGRVQVAGMIRVMEPLNRLSIVGGTGRFEGARGSVTVERVSADGSKQKARLRFLR